MNGYYAGYRGYEGLPTKQTYSYTTYQDTLYLKQKAAAESAEAERLKAQNELEKTKTEYLAEQVKSMGLPDYPRVDVPIAVEQAPSLNIASLGLIGLGIWFLMKRKGK